METKSWYKSKTIWISILEVVAGVSMGLKGLLETGIAISILAVVQIILRVITSSSLITPKVADETKPTE
ncbi:MAG: hypothetical protein JSV32_02015 [Dehalococcoidia bacterium]|nr:MAG: hypothetical protein JSV32_02015 [Dehalococcoidia bacterium]